MAYLIDTNIIIYYFNGLTDDDLIHHILQESFNISIITQIEFLGWRQFSANQGLYKNAKTFLSYANVFELNQAIAEESIGLRQTSKVKIPDAIIAATAIVNNFTVVTNNTSDFVPLGVKAITVKTK